MFNFDGVHWTIFMWIHPFLILRRLPGQGSRTHHVTPDTLVFRPMAYFRLMFAYGKRWIPVSSASPINKSLLTEASHGHGRLTPRLHVIFMSNPESLSPWPLLLYSGSRVRPMSLQVWFLPSDITWLSSRQQLAGVFTRMVSNPERDWEHHLPVNTGLFSLQHCFAHRFCIFFLLLRLLCIFSYCGFTLFIACVFGNGIGLGFLALCPATVQLWSRCVDEWVFSACDLDGYGCAHL